MVGLLANKEKNTWFSPGVLHIKSGNDLLFQDPSVQVPSAQRGLTAVFGMGTGGSLSPLSPERLIIFDSFGVSGEWGVMSGEWFSVFSLSTPHSSLSTYLPFENFTEFNFVRVILLLQVKSSTY